MIKVFRHPEFIIIIIIIIIIINIGRLSSKEMLDELVGMHW